MELQVVAQHTLEFGLAVVVSHVDFEGCLGAVAALADGTPFRKKKRIELV